MSKILNSWCLHSKHPPPQCSLTPWMVAPLIHLHNPDSPWLPPLSKDTQQSNPCLLFSIFFSAWQLSEVLFLLQDPRSCRCGIPSALKAYLHPLMLLSPSQCLSTGHIFSCVFPWADFVHAPKGKEETPFRHSGLCLYGCWMPSPFL